MLSAFLLLLRIRLDVVVRLKADLLVCLVVFRKPRNGVCLFFGVGLVIGSGIFLVFVGIGGEVIFLEVIWIGEVKVVF